MTSTLDRADQARPSGSKPVIDGRRGGWNQFAVYAFVLVPMIALVASIPFAWGWGLSWVDVALAVVFFYVSGLGVTIGYHRLFTHSSFKANRWLRVTLAVCGSMAVQGPPIIWVADHRAITRSPTGTATRTRRGCSARRRSPSPRASGTRTWAGCSTADLTNKQRFAPDLLADADIVRVNDLFVVITAGTLLLPALLGGLITWSWWGALTAFFWASLVRIAVLHHVTWSTNSICHMIGERPFAARDKSANFWPLAILSFGESWHNLHHADPTCARHGVRRGQIDTSARLIWMFEKFGWVRDVRWPTPQRLARIASATE